MLITNLNRTFKVEKKFKYKINLLVICFFINKGVFTTLLC